jgi:hypothetical protein
MFANFTPTKPLNHTTMSQELNKILAYLNTNNTNQFNRRTKQLLRKIVLGASSNLDAYLCRLTKDGYIRLYLHPNVGLNGLQELDTDLKLSCSITDEGITFIQQGGYQGKMPGVYGPEILPMRESA